MDLLDPRSDPKVLLAVADARSDADPSELTFADATGTGKVVYSADGYAISFRHSVISETPYIR